MGFIFISVVIAIFYIGINETLEQIRDGVRNQRERYVPAYRSGPAFGATPRRKNRRRSAV